MLLTLIFAIQEADASNGIRIKGFMKGDNEVVIVLENKSNKSFNTLALQAFNVQIKEILTPEGWYAQPNVTDKPFAGIVITSKDQINVAPSSLQFTFKINSGEEKIKFKWSAHGSNYGPVTIDYMVAKGAFKIMSGNQISQYAPSNVKCDGKLIPPRDDKNGITILLMQPNSTATACVTYEFVSDWLIYPNKYLYPEGVARFSLGIGKFNKDTPPDLFGMSAIPNKLNVTGATNGTKFTVLYKIYATPDSKGFYDYSVRAGLCNHYPLAVGYAASQVHASDFSPEIGIPPLCAFILYKVDSVRISGMDYTQIVFPPP
ncbi:MAG: hypothetical protein HMLIMOIP_000661 [Candidatus Nitrosomirales archaeon]|jgi:hypothetical protein